MSLERSKTAGHVTEITHIVPFKPGGPVGLHGIRYADRCRIVLEAFARFEGEGFVLPVRRFSGIHFARWALIDADTRLLFTTNFDGTWDEYIRAFVREIPWSLGLLWQNCENYPSDRIGDDGSTIPAAADYALFSKFVERYQVESSLFYADYGELTVRDIRYLRVFHQEATRMLGSGGDAPTLGALQQRVMARQRDLDFSYRGLPTRRFPDPRATDEMPEDAKAAYRVRVGEPVRRLYGYDDSALHAVLAEFRLLPNATAASGGTSQVQP
jgi:hypothetical protein